MRSAKQGKPRALLRLLKKEMKIKSSAYARIPKPASTGVENADEFTLKKDECSDVLCSLHSQSCSELKAWFLSRKIKMAGAHDCFKLEKSCLHFIYSPWIFANFDPDATKMDVIEM